jgi:UDP-glucose:tetrahydrobiopterin glucosyltransferase
MKNAAIMASAIAPLGDPALGGMNPAMLDLCLALQNLRYRISIICPKNSLKIFKNADYYEIDGKFQSHAQTTNYHHTEALISNMWAFWEKNKKNWDLTINLSYDLLPLEKTISSNEIILNYISMCHQNDDFTQLLGLCLKSKPGSCCFLNPYHFETFCIKATPVIVSSPVELGSNGGGNFLRKDLMWMGRVSPEKGLEYALSIAKLAGRRLLIAGHIQDESYWQNLQKNITPHDYELLGQLEKKQLYQHLQKVEALLVTPICHEALGLIVLEALANKTPVIGFDSPGPRWIIEQTGGGILVEPKNVHAGSLAINKIKELDMQEAYRNIQIKFS